MVEIMEGLGEFVTSLCRSLEIEGFKLGLFCAGVKSKEALLEWVAGEERPGDPNREWQLLFLFECGLPVVKALAFLKLLRVQAQSHAIAPTTKGENEMGELQEQEFTREAGRKLNKMTSRSVQAQGTLLQYPTTSVLHWVRKALEKGTSDIFK